MSEIYYEIHGHGRPLVMLHGWAMHSGIWRDFAKRLAEHRQVICLDLPGHGRSAPLEPFELSAIRKVLLEVIPVESFSLLGWSLGATVAVEMAARDPQRVRSLCLLSGNPKFVRDHDWPGVKPEVLDGFAAQLSGDARQTLQRFLGLQVQGLEDGRPLLQRLKHAVLECEAPALSALQGGLQILKHSDLRNSLAALRQPIKVIQGDKDTLIPFATASALRALNPLIDAHVLTGAGHVPFLSHAEELLDLVAEV